VSLLEDAVKQLKQGFGAAKTDELRADLAMRRSLDASLKLPRSAWVATFAVWAVSVLLIVGDLGLAYAIGKHAQVTYPRRGPDGRFIDDAKCAAGTDVAQTGT
jgi:hypothetical protein